MSKKTTKKIGRKFVKHRRECRCELQKWEIDEDKKKDVLKFKNGHLGSEYINVEGNKLIFTMKSKDERGVYPDDVLAIVRDILFSYKGPKADQYTKFAICSVTNAISSLDKRAFEKHGYSRSEEQAKYVPPWKDEESDERKIETHISEK